MIVGSRKSVRVSKEIDLPNGDLEMFRLIREVALRAQRVLHFCVMFLLAAISVFASSSTLAQVAVFDAAVGSNTAAINGQMTTANATLTALQTFLTTQLTPTAVPAGVPPVYAAVNTPMLPVVCPVTLNAVAMARMTAACATLNADIAAFNAAQAAFNTQLTTLGTQIQTISAMGVGTTANILGASLQLQAVQAHQSNLVGRHMANVEWMKLRLNNAEKAFMQARAIMKFGEALTP
jgi:hypothetical protein